MSNVECKISHRLLAALLAVLMVFSTLPLAVVVNAATTEYPDVFTITVTDGENPIKGAAVKVFNDSEDLYMAADPEDPESQEQDYRFLYDELTTDENGVVVIEDITALSAELELVGINSFTVNYEVTMTDFEGASGSVEVTPENAVSLNVDVKLVSTLISDVTIEGKSYVYDGVEKELVSVTKIEGDIVTYSVDGGEATDVVPVATDVCEHEIVVTVEREGKTTLKKTVTGKITPADITDISIEGKDLSYNEGEQDLVILNGSFKEGDVVTWTVNEDDIVSTDIPTKMAVGTYTVTLTVERVNYNKFVSQAVLTTISASSLDLEGLRVSGLEGIYKIEDGKPVAQPAVTVENQGDYDLKYQLTDKEDGAPDPGAWVDEIPTVTNAGSYIIWVKAEKEGYNSADVDVFPAASAVTPFNVYIAKASQSFDFDEYDAMGEGSTPESIKLEGSAPYEKKLEFSATDEAGLANGSITYSIETDEEGIASIDSDTGVLTINYPGSITVVATLSGNENYSDCSIYYYLDVTAGVSAKGDYIGFTDAEVTYVLGTSDIISSQIAEKHNMFIRGEITYSMDTVSGVSFDAGTGKVSVSDYEKLASAIRKSNGKIDVVVTATKAATAIWGEDTASYSISIVFEETPSSAYTLSEVDGTNGWYKSDVVVTPVSGYSIAKSVKDKFAETVAFADQGTKERCVYLRNTTTGGITDTIAVLDSEGKELSVDTAKPDTANMMIEFSDPVWPEKLARILTLGFYNPSVTITFTAQDDTSGIDHFNWSYTKTENSGSANAGDKKDIPIDVTVENGVATAVLTLTASEAEQYNGKISFTATDVAGNTSEYKADGYVFVVDTISPTMSVKYQGEEPYAGAIETIGDVHYFDGDVEVTITVNEANFYSDEFSVLIQKDGGDLVPVTTSWTSNSVDEHIGVFTISGDGDYIVKLTYEDRSGNTMTEYQSETITVDTIDPEVKVEYTHNGDTQTVIFTVIEHNFREVDVTVSDASVFADINGNPLSITAANLTEILRAAEWKQDENNKDKYTFVYDELPNGRYDIKLDYVDIVKRSAATFDADDFIVDHDVPTNVSIEYLTKPLNTFVSFVTLGFYNPSVEVKFTAYDTSAGVKSFTWSYTKADGASDKQTDDILASEDTTVVAVQDNDDPSKFTATITLTAEQYGQLKGNLAVYATDDFNNKSETTVDSGMVIVVDTVAPTVEVTYSPADKSVEEAKNYYYKGDIIVTLNVNESNFFAEDVVVKVSKDGAEATAVYPEWSDVSVDEHIGTFTLSGDGDYIVTVEYKDRSYNPDSEFNNEILTYTSDIHTIDTVDPIISFEYDKESQKTVFTIKEHNFFAEGITVEGSIRDITQKDLAFTPEGLTEVLRKAKWTQDGDVYTFEYDYCPDNSYANGIYDLNISVADLATRETSYEADNFIIDHEPPTPVEITYSQSLIETVVGAVTLGFYNPNVTVTFTAHDYASGVQSFAYEYTKESGASSVNTDRLQGVLKATQDETDTSLFTASVTLPAEQAEQLRGYISALATDKYGNNDPDEKVVDQNNVIIVDTISPTMSVKYQGEEPYAGAIETIGNVHYFDGNITVALTVTEANFFAEDVKVTVTKDGGDPYEVTPTWNDESVDVHIGTYTLSGDGDYTVAVEYKDRSYNPESEFNNKILTYTSETLTIDTTLPVLDFYFDKEAQTTTFTVTEHNFRPSDITVTGDIGDITGAPIQHTGETITNILRNAQWTQNGDTYTYIFDYSFGDDFANGIYDLEISYTDISTNSGNTIEPEKFIIDHDAPTDVKIEYSQSLMNTVLSTVTLGFYNPDVTVTFTAHDYASGVQSFAYEYTKESSASSVNTDRLQGVLKATQDETDTSLFTASVTLPADRAEQLKGFVSVVATDEYNNSADEVEDDDYVVIVDTISPTIKVEYSVPDRVVDNTSYYKGNIDVTFIVTEANFFADDVYVLISKDGGTAKRVIPEWTDKDVDTHIGKYTITGDGDYVVTVNYTDRSNNEMVQYTSDIKTIDTIRPVIKVDYQNKNIINSLPDRNNNNRKYYDNTQTVVVTVTEHNFLPGEVDFIITATDVSGNTLNVNSLHSKEKAWTSEGDVHTMTITFPGDANYSFDVAYSDLATNAAADYAVDYFTVDKTAPENIKVEYSTSMLETVLESITFGFYNAKMTVTIRADDSVSGVHGFVYSYLNAEGVSGVNAELINQEITAADIEYSNNGRTAKISFEIPKLILNNDNQFNGTVSFVVSDRTNKTTEQSENKRIVVDNIAPTAQVAYNEATNVEGDISYYNGDINVTITVNEANFYSEDVKVLVSKDHGAAAAITPNWTNNSVDIHVGTFTLTEDGDYVITINYEDKSANKMAEYVSKHLIIDTVIEAPTYEINNVEKEEIGGAYKNDATVSFNFEDQNFDVNTVKLVKTRFDKVEDVTDQFITVTDNEKGGSGSFTIPETVENDGVYVLTISMNDKAKHSVESHVKFTINRFGSVYEYSESLINLIKDGGQYVNSVDDALVITEYNADRIVEDSLNVLITRDGQSLDVEYSTTPDVIDTNVDVGESGWYEYVYTIDPSNFAEDGVYKITITSKYDTDDEESNDSTSVPENSIDSEGNQILDTMTFTVDDTAPEVRNIVNLDKAIVNAQSVDVKFTIVDVGGLKTIEIILNGEIVDTITEFGDGPFNYSGQFTINERSEAQTVQIKATDLAGNVTDTSSEDFSTGDLYIFNGRVTVSTNIFVRWYANKPLFWGSIGGVVIAAAAVCVIVILKRKKKEETK